MKLHKAYNLTVTDAHGTRVYRFHDGNIGRLFCEHTNYQNDAFVAEKWKRLDIADLVKGKTVLDLGCCSGKQLVNCNAAGAAGYAGVDSNWRYLEDCRDNGLAGRLVLMDLNDFADSWQDAFDVVLCLATLHYISDKESFLRRVAAITRDTFVLESPVENGDPSFAPPLDELEAMLGRHFDYRRCGESVSPSARPEFSKRFIWRCRPK